MHVAQPTHGCMTVMQLLLVCYCVLHRAFDAVQEHSRLHTVVLTNVLVQD